MKVFIYSRVSTDKQTTDSQLQELRDYCMRRNWVDVREVTDIVSGAKFSRKGLDELMRLVRRGKVDIIICYKLDRLGRSLSHLAQLVEEFAIHKVALVVPVPQQRLVWRAVELGESGRCICQEPWRVSIN